jgi:hypothetical protein
VHHSIFDIFSQFNEISGSNPFLIDLPLFRRQPAATEMLTAPYFNIQLNPVLNGSYPYDFSPTIFARPES